MIEVVDLAKSYAETRALKGISFSIRPGEVVGLLGPNGAGKSTAMRILVGYLRPSDGTARVGGFDVTRDPLEVQRKVGYLPENAPLYAEMQVHEFLRFTADMRGLDVETRARRTATVTEQCAIGDVMSRPIGHLSKGYRQRVGLAAALIHDPPILILDEPTTGLDPNQIVEVRGLIRRLGETKTVILSTHILPEVEATCGRAVILIDGLVRADGSLAELTRSKAHIVTVATDDPGRARELFERLDNVANVEVREATDGFHSFRLGLKEDREIGERIAAVVREQGWAMRELGRDDRSLEQVFRELTESKEEAA